MKLIIKNLMKKYGKTKKNINQIDRFLDELN